MNELTKLREQRKTKAAELKALYEEGGGSDNLDLSSITSLKGSNNDKINELRKRKDELDEIGTKAQELADLQEQAKALEVEETKAQEADEARRQGRQVPAGTDQEPLKSLGRAILDSGIIKAATEGKYGKVDIEDFNERSLKATFSEAQSYEPESLRRMELLTPMGYQEPMTIDALPMSRTSYVAVKYMEQTTRTNAASERDENTAYAESTYVYTERSQDVETVGHRLPVTDEMLEDEPWIESILNQDMIVDLRRRVSSQQVNGTGTNAGTVTQILGILNKAGINTLPRGGLSLLDAIFHGCTQAEVAGFCMPNLVIIHPNDWRDIRLSKSDDGYYLFGPPQMSGADMVWGLPRIKTQEIAEGTALCGDTMYTTLAVRRGVMVETGYNASDFSEGRKTIRVGIRCAQVIRRAATWTQVTGA